jgi:hypothetical protein
MWEKSRVLNIIEGLQIPDILEICYFNINMSINMYQSRHRFFCLYHLSLICNLALLKQNRDQFNKFLLLVSNQLYTWNNSIVPTYR